MLSVSQVKQYTVQNGFLYYSVWKLQEPPKQRDNQNKEIKGKTLVIPNGCTGYPAFFGIWYPAGYPVSLAGYPAWWIQDFLPNYNKSKIKILIKIWKLLIKLKLRISCSSLQQYGEMALSNYTYINRRGHCTGYPVSGKIVCRISGGQISSQFSIWRNPKFQTGMIIIVLMSGIHGTWLQSISPDIWVQSLQTLLLKTPGKVYTLAVFSSNARQEENILCHNNKNLGYEIHMNAMCNQVSVHLSAIQAEELKL